MTPPIAGGLELWQRRLRLMTRVRVGAWVASAAAGLAAVGMVVWAVTQPGPSVAAVAPELPSWDVMEPPPVTVALAETLFLVPTPPSVAKKAAAPVVDTASAWRLLGVDASGGAPRALLKDGKEGRSVWVSVGDQVQELTVTVIESGRVVLEGADGARELRL